MTKVEYSKHQFARHLGQRFRVGASGAAPIELELSEVTRLDASAPRPFALSFLGPSAPVLPQKIYRLEHDDLEPFDIFLVPVGHDRDRLVYEAIFN